MVREFAFSSTGSVSLRGFAAVGFAAIAALCSRIKLANRPAASAEPRSAAVSYHFRAASMSGVMETAPSCLMTDGS